MCVNSPCAPYRILSDSDRPALRLFPPVPVNNRTAHETTTLPTGGGPDGTSPILVRKGENVAYCVYAMHRRKDLYGTDAEDFRPERWDDANLPLYQDSVTAAWGYLPFNGGPRVCLGRKHTAFHRKFPHDCTLTCCGLALHLYRRLRPDGSVLYRRAPPADIPYDRHGRLSETAGAVLAGLFFAPWYRRLEDGNGAPENDTGYIDRGRLPREALESRALAHVTSMLVVTERDAKKEEWLADFAASSLFI